MEKIATEDVNNKSFWTVKKALLDCKIKELNERRVTTSIKIINCCQIVMSYYELRNVLKAWKRFSSSENKKTRQKEKYFPILLSPLQKGKTPLREKSSQ